MAAAWRSKDPWRDRLSKPTIPRGHDIPTSSIPGRSHWYQQSIEEADYRGLSFRGLRPHMGRSAAHPSPLALASVYPDRALQTHRKRLHRPIPSCHMDFGDWSILECDGGFRTDGNIVIWDGGTTQLPPMAGVIEPSAPPVARHGLSQCFDCDGPDPLKPKGAGLLKRGATAAE